MAALLAITLSTAAHASVVSWGRYVSLRPVEMRGTGDVRQVIAGYGATWALRANGTVEAWGANTFGQLGDGSRRTSLEPVLAAGLSGVREIAAANAHVMALLANGTVATWGANSSGELGNGVPCKSEICGGLVPEVVKGLSRVKAIFAGGGDDAAILADGTVRAWGEDRNGQLGDGATADKFKPITVRGLSGVRALAFGGTPSQGGFMLALLEDGTVRAIGTNAHGELGDASTTNSTRFVAVYGLSHVTALAAGTTHSLAVLADGSVAAWGGNRFGQLGARSKQRCGKRDERARCATTPLHVRLGGVSAVSAGLDYSLAISNGVAMSWGWGEQGQLGTGGKSNASAPTPVLGGVTAISAGEFHSAALTMGGAASVQPQTTPRHSRQRPRNRR